MKSYSLEGKGSNHTSCLSKYRHSLQHENKKKLLLVVPKTLFSKNVFFVDTNSTDGFGSYRIVTKIMSLNSGTAKTFDLYVILTSAACCTAERRCRPRISAAICLYKYMLSHFDVCPDCSRSWLPNSIFTGC